MKPINDRVAVLPLEAETVTSGGIIIPATAAEKVTRGVVHAVGPHVDQVAVGDKVLYGKYAGQDIEYNDEFLPEHVIDPTIYKIMREDEVLLILEDHE